MAGRGPSLGSGHVTIGGEIRDLQEAMAQAKGLTTRTMREIGAMHADPKITLDTGELIRKKEAIDRELADLDKRRADVTVDMDKALFDARAAELMRQKELLGRNIDIVVNLKKGDLGQARKELARLNREVVSGRGPIRDWLSNIGRIRVQAGFTSLSLRQLGIVIGTLGPVLTGLVGAATAVVGSLGEGIAGATAVGAAGLTGFSLAAFGVFEALKPAATEFKNAETAFTNYNKAVELYGKHSDEAKNYQDQLNQAVKGMSPPARQAFTQFRALSDQYQKLTAPTRGNFFKDISSSLGAAKSLLPTFAKNVNQAFGSFSKGWQGWMQSLRSPEASRLLDNIMGNFADSIPNIMSGLGSLAHAFANVASVASSFLPSLTGGFKQWAQGIENATENTGKLKGQIGDMIGQMQSWGHLLQSTGRLLLTVLGGGAKSGRDMVDALTDTENRWRSFLQTARGQQSMADFFDRSKNTTEGLASALTKVVTILEDLSRATEPFSAGILAVANAVGDIGHALASMPGFSQALELGGALFAINAIQKRLGLMIEGARAFAARNGFGAGAAAEGENALAAAEARQAEAANAAAVANERLATSNAAVAESSAAADATMLPAVIPGRGRGTNIPGYGTVGGTAEAEAKAAAAAEAELATEAAAAETAVAGTGAEVGLLGGALGGLPFLAVGAAGIGAFIGIKAAIDSANERAAKFKADLKTIHAQGTKPSNAFFTGDDHTGEQNAAAQASAVQDMAVGLNHAQRAAQGLLQTEPSLQAAQKAYNKAVQQHGQYSLQAAYAEDNLRKAEGARNKSLAGLRDNTNRVRAAVKAATNAARDQLKTDRQGQAAARAHGRAIKLNAQAEGDSAAKNDELAQAMGRTRDAQRNLEREQNQGAFAMVQMQRGFQGTQKLSESAAQSIGQFARSFKGIPQVKKFLVQTNSAAAVSKVSQVGNKLDALGGHKAVVRIIGDSKSAEEAFRRISKKIAEVEHRKAVMSIKENGAEAVIARLAKLAGYKLPDKEQKIIGNNNDAIGKLQDVIRQTLPLKTQRIIESGASSVFGVLSSLASYTLPTIVQHIVQQVTKGHATGGVESMSSGSSMKATRPGYRYGEEAPTHPEYIIATNPAYRGSNVNFLGQAAAALGMAVVPAFRGGGKHGGHHGGHHGPDSGLLFGSTYQRLENRLSHMDEVFGLDQANYQADLAAGRAPNPTLQDLIGEKRDAIKTSKQLEKVIRKMLKGDRTTLNHDKGRERHLKHELKRAQHMDIPKVHGKSGSKENRTSQKRHDDAVQARDKRVQKLQDDISKLKQRDKNIKGNYPGLYDELIHSLPDRIYGYHNDLQDLMDQKQGIAADAGLEQTSSGRSLYELLTQYGGNTSDLITTFGPAAAAVGTAVSNMTTAVPSGSGAASMASGGSAYSPIAAAASSARAGRSSGQAPASPAKVINIAHNYAHAPADPHTWSRSVEHELRSLG